MTAVLTLYVKSHYCFMRKSRPTFFPLFLEWVLGTPHIQTRLLVTSSLILSDWHNWSLSYSVIYGLLGCIEDHGVDIDLNLWSWISLGWWLTVARFRAIALAGSRFLWMVGRHFWSWWFEVCYLTLSPPPLFIYNGQGAKEDQVHACMFWNLGDIPRLPF